MSPLKNTNLENNSFKKNEEIAFAVYVDSISYGISNKNELMAVFKLEHQAKIFGETMWGEFYIIEEIVSNHFN